MNNTKNLLAFLNKIIYNIPRHLIYGELSELVEGARLEIVCTQKVPGVRISPSPPDFNPSWFGTVQKVIPGKGLGEMDCPAKRIKRHRHPPFLGVFQGVH